MVSRACREAVADALSRLGCGQIRWKGGSVHFETGGQRVQLGPEVLPEWVRAIGPPIDRERLAIEMSDVTGITPPRDVARELALVRDRLVPRVVDRSAFSGPDRTMCRREVGTDLYAALWIGIGHRGLWVTTEELDAWPVGFDDCFAIARENQRSRIESGSINEIRDGYGVLAALAEGVDMGGAMLDAASMLPDQFGSGRDGALVSTPAAGTLLLLPVRDGIGAEGVASIVQIADMLRDDEGASEVQRRIYWALPDPEAGLLGYGLERLPVTVVHEGGSRRAHVDSSDLVQSLLRRLGEIE